MEGERVTRDGGLPLPLALRLCADNPKSYCWSGKGSGPSVSIVILLAFPSWASGLEASPQKSLKIKAVARVPWSPSRAEKLVHLHRLE